MSKYKRYAKGGQFNKKRDNAQEGLRQFTTQQERIIAAEEKQRKERLAQGQQQVADLRGTARNEEQVRNEITNFENKEFEYQRASIQQRSETDRRSLDTQIAQTRAAGDRWRDFSQTQMKGFFKLADNLQDYRDINKAISDYKKYKENNLLDPLYQVEDLTNQKAEKGMAAQRWKAWRKGDFDTSDYLGSVHRNNNHYYHELIVNDIKQNIDVHEEQLLQFLDENKLELRKEDIHDYYQFRAQEIVKQTGLPSKSAAALKVHDFFNHRANLKYSNTAKNDLRLLQEQNYDKSKKFFLNGGDSLTGDNLNHLFIDKLELLKGGDRDKYISPSEGYRAVLEDLIKHPKYRDNWNRFKNEVLSLESVGDNAKERQPLSLKIPAVVSDLRNKWVQKNKDIKASEKHLLDKKDTDNLKQILTEIDGDEYDLNDYTEGGGRDQLYKIAATEGTKTKKAIYELLNYDPQGLVPDSIHEKIMKAGTVDRDYEEFMFYYRNLSKEDKARYTKLPGIKKDLESVIQAYGFDYQKVIRSNVEYEIKEIAGIDTLDETLSPTAYRAIPAVEQKFYSLWEDNRDITDPNERKRLTLEQLGKIIDNKESGLLRRAGSLDKATSGTGENVEFLAFKNTNKNKGIDGYRSSMQEAAEQSVETGKSLSETLDVFIDNDKDNINNSLATITQLMDKGEDITKFPDVVEGIHSYLKSQKVNIRKKEIGNLLLERLGFQQRFELDYVDQVQAKTNTTIQNPRNAMATDFAVSYKQQTGTLPMKRYMRFYQQNKTLDANTQIENVLNLQSTLRENGKYYTGESVESVIKNGHNFGLYYNAFTNITETF